jgi:hypothetical protein
MLSARAVGAGAGDDLHALLRALDDVGDDALVLVVAELADSPVLPTGDQTVYAGLDLLVDQLTRGRGSRFSPALNGVISAVLVPSNIRLSCCCGSASPPETGGSARLLHVRPIFPAQKGSSCRTERCAVQTAAAASTRDCQVLIAGRKLP